MSKLFIGFLVVAVVIFGVALSMKKSQPQEAKIGAKQQDQGQSHIKQGEEHKPYNSSPASSGPHYADASAPIDWGVYIKEVPAEVFLHNAEHGGVIVTYNPKLLPANQVKRLQQLFAPPYSNNDFKPNRFILTPRSSNTRAIELASWRYTLSLDRYDEVKLIKFYEQRSNKSPEAGASPTNVPINQVAVNS